ncbi:ABC transporter ATP-binding protein [Pseudobacteriovorax antillogorgiicola]|uniref:Phospholipid/cholesterol/gamma-HCH transport system ATP-binding protein n=1 Tax=Pseudobacteriovorax antillogorgiicola TaxID=1513793 RepID=A0A1Y6BUU9_9BACT|nr:ATP-binding cassette domain-containing protein [Pseudobacteriovorax antillogorgiicola]TCS53869.1 phospholipid/cholesterol/gamma-HCH transport system ATP-binding protein [Pseudobacteriovorax antillogorgiicola]SMF21348.1 phospholipid/cholesterol/gamma-HCH transport system ATP-binding protein [Pseudobacteriovorax antillogorgiicola]
MIRFEHVTKQFGSFKVLDDLDVEIPKGKITVIIGKSGEGKSVTIKHIMGLLKPTKGRVFVDGEDITDFEIEDLKRIRRKIGMLFQHAALFDSLSVFENVAFPVLEHENVPFDELKDRVGEVLDMVGLPGIEKKFPGELSTGEKKRVGLARALIHKPKIILYDEPTTGMDPLVSEMIDELIVAVNQNNPELTSVVISHDLKAALDISENVVMLYKGKVQLAASPEEFRNTSDPVIRQFFSGKVDGPMEFM